MEREPHEVLGVSRFAPWPEIRSAFRSLARRYHADGSMPDPRRMALVNDAYEALERARVASGGDAAPGAGLSGSVPVGPGRPSAPASSSTPSPDSGQGQRWSAGGQSRPPEGSLLWRIQAARHVESPVLDFGQYAGWPISQVAEHDPRYLVWLSRHSSGVRFRRAIEQVLGSNHDLGRPAAVIS